MHYYGLLFANGKVSLSKDEANGIGYNIVTTKEKALICYDKLKQAGEDVLLVEVVPVENTDIICASDDRWFMYEVNFVCTL